MIDLVQTYLALGEGYHNYHHTFPYDYSASELGWRHNYNLATAFIDLFAWLGLAYDRKVPTQAMIQKKAQQTGDESLRQYTRSRKLNSSSLLDNLLGLISLTWPVWTVQVFRWLVYIVKWIRI